MPRLPPRGRYPRRPEPGPAVTVPAGPDHHRGRAAPQRRRVPVPARGAGHPDGGRAGTHAPVSGAEQVLSFRDTAPATCAALPRYPRRSAAGTRAAPVLWHGGGRPVCSRRSPSPGSSMRTTAEFPPPAVAQRVAPFHHVPVVDIGDP